MATSVTVELLTTCCREGPPWRDRRDPGVWRAGALTQRRFRSDYPTVLELEERLGKLVRAGDTSLDLQKRWLQERGPYSSALLEHIEGRRGDFDAFVFFSLESATTVFGLPLVGAGAVLAPAVEDWAAARSELLRTTLDRASGFVFSCEEERRRVRGLGGAGRPDALVQGASAEPYLDVARRSGGGTPRARMEEEG